MPQAPVQFESAADVPLGGVLGALPALLAEGPLRHRWKLFALPEGFHPLETIFLVSRPVDPGLSDSAEAFGDPQNAACTLMAEA